MTSPLAPLSGSVRADPGRVVLTVVGEIDLSTASQFHALLDEAVSLGTSPTTITVDMAGVSFCDAQMLGVLVDVNRRLEAVGSRLTVRSVPERIYRLFEVTGLIDVLHVEGAAVNAALLRSLTSVAGLALSREVLDAALKLVVTMAQTIVEGADGVSITLPRHGVLGTVAASNDVVLEMDHDQYDTGEGPCLDAALQGRRFHIPALATEERWPAFVPRARAHGIETILSTPLLAAEQPIGALNIYSRTEGAFAQHEMQWADQFAAEASAVVTSADPGSFPRHLNAQIQQALHSRETIAMAQGVVMHRDGLSATGAYAELREISRQTGRPLREVCDELVSLTGGGLAASRPPRQADS